MKCIVMSMTKKPATPRWDPGTKSAAIGGLTWLVWAIAARPEWTVVLLLLSPFVLLPLGLRLAARADTGPEVPGLRRLAQLSPAFAITAAASYLPDPGALAALLSVPWLGFTLVVASAGFGRLLSRRTLIDPGIGADAGLVFLAVGGAWLTISRAGLNPLGFSDAIVQLTAVHFHYAGFALPIVAGLTASCLQRSILVPLAVIVGVPLTAIGIIFGGWLEWFSATAMALAGIATAAMLLQFSTHQRGAARWLIGAAGSALLAGMSLAIGWAWSHRFGWDFLGLDSMAAIHGSLNALGFGLLGLIGLNILTPIANHKTGSTNFHLGRPSRATLERFASVARDQETTNPVGLLSQPTPDGFQRQTWRKNVEHGDFAAAAEAIRQWHGHEAAGIKRWPAQPEIRTGQTLALAIPVGPISFSATCRIVDVIDEPHRYGFIYSTLPHHPEDGEESFVVTQHADGRVDVAVTAVWRAVMLGNHLCPPLTRFLQNRAIIRYLDGIATSQSHTRRTSSGSMRIEQIYPKSHRPLGRS